MRQVETGDPSMVGETMALGIVEAVDRDRMVLKTDAGEEVFRRSP